MTRLMTFSLALAFAGTLCLVGCDEQKPAPPPPSKDLKAPAAPGGTPAPKEGEKKVGDATTSAGAALGAAVKDGAAKVEVTMTCAKADCKEAGNPLFKLTKDGKTMLFCCNNCMTAYKTANNIQ